MPNDLPPDLQPEADLWFNPYRCPRTDAGRAVVTDVITQLENLEKHIGLRKRAHKVTDQAIFEATVSAIVCDLLHSRLAGRSGALAITRSHQILGHRSRYRPAIYGKVLRQLLDELATPEMSFVIQTIGGSSYEGAARRTTIAPGPRLLSKIEEFALRAGDFSLSKEEELIVLKRAKSDFWDAGGEVEYEDTAVTRRFREEIIAINEWLDQADIAFVGESQSVDDRDRRLRRFFTLERFDSGGRLFGGFWQQLKKQERLAGLRMNGQKVAGLDYGQANPRILYGLAGELPPPGDLYLIPGLEKHRDGVKKVFNAMLFATSPLTKMPRGLKINFGHGTRVGDVVDRIQARHPALSPFFHSGIGHDIQFTESQIMVRLLLDLKSQGIVALPIHDAVVVPRSVERQVTEQMLHTFRSIAKTEGLVREDG